MTPTEVATEVGVRFSESVSMLIRGALDEMVLRGCDREKSIHSLKEILKFIANKGPRPIGAKATEPEQEH
jgi:hypothetical protein